MPLNSRHTREIAIALDQPGALQGLLTVPDRARGLVVFVHGSGSSRFSQRNQGVAAALNADGFATLLADLLTPDEQGRDELTAEYRFDIELLAERVARMLDWVGRQAELVHLSLGLFGASTGAAAALLVAAERPAGVAAVVSRGGRPDLAGAALSQVHVPTLLIVGGRDREVIVLNRRAAERMATEPKLVLVPGASHLFEEPGALAEVARLAADWFERHLVAPPRSGAMKGAGSQV